MDQCQCLTGKNVRCSRTAKDGEQLCYQHKKSCKNHVQKVQHVQPVQRVQPVQHVQRVQPVQRVQKVQRVQPVEVPKPAKLAPKVAKAPKVPKVQKPEAVKPSRGCVRQSLAKYEDRPSPPYPANECCGEIKKGNDGRMYISKANVKGICQWKPFKG